MKTMWVVVANRINAKLYQRIGRAGDLTLIQELDHEEGRLKNQDIDADRPGESFSSGRSGGRHNLEPEVDSKEHLLVMFAKQIAQLLTQGANERKFEELVLVAEPHFLGRLRDKLDKRIEAMVVGTLKKDFGRSPEPQVLAELKHELSTLATHSSAS